MTQTALAVFRLGHLPMLGEWPALPLIEAAGADEMVAIARQHGKAVYMSIGEIPTSA